MSNYNVEFRLWLRRSSLMMRRTTSGLYDRYKDVINFFSGLGSFIVAVVAFILAIRDTNQQTQINNLKNILAEVQKQNGNAQSQIDQLKSIANDIKQQNSYTQDQTKELIGIAKLSRDQNELSNDLLKRVEKQTGLTYQQLLLSRKSDSTSSLELELQEQTNIFNLEGNLSEVKSIFDWYDNEYFRINYSNDKPSPLDSSEHQLYKAFFVKLAKAVQKGLSNKFLISDAKLLQLWYNYFLKIQK